MRVGVLLRPSRFDDLRESGLLADCEAEEKLTEDHIQFYLADSLGADNSDQIFDVLLHKISDFLVDDAALQRAKYFLNSRSIAVIDPIDNVWKVFDRLETAALLSDLSGILDQVAWGTPPYIEASENDTLQQMKRNALSAGVELPGILKAALAAGMPESHRMAVLLSWEGLAARWQSRSILQSFVNHGGILYKVYVLGNMVSVKHKPSIPDLSLPSHAALKLVEFDSLALNDTWQSKQGQCAPSADYPSLNQAGVENMAARLREALQLDLFGFDVIVDRTGKHYVIDVNYFPSYKGVSGAQAALHDVILRRKQSFVTGSHAAI